MATRNMLEICKRTEKDTTKGEPLYISRDLY